MDSFQKIVLGISLFLLILVLIAVGLMMSLQTSVNVFPPIQQPCPDGWNSDSSGNCYFLGKNGGTAILPNGTINQNTGSKVTSQYPLYPATNNNGIITFDSGNYSFGIPSHPPLDNSITNTVIFNKNDPYWTSQGGTNICAQQKFANQYNIYWDGISNTNQCTSK
jgi:ABC-type transport system involved in multi-copper enzyme maturation permease subunit